MLSPRNLGVLVGRARKVLRREFEARLVDHDLTVPQVHVLRTLWDEDGQAINHLSNYTCSDGPTLTSLLDRMETKGLICRKRDPNDRRVVRIFLEERGRALEDYVCSAGDEVIAIVQRGMSDEQIEQLCTLLDCMCETLEHASEVTAH